MHLQWSNGHEATYRAPLLLGQHGTIQGVHVWYHVRADRQQAMASASSSSESPSVFVPHDLIRQRESVEHLEALLFEAIEACHPHRDWPGTAVVVSPRRIAVVWDKVINRGEIVPVDLVLPRLTEDTRTAVVSWLQAPKTRLHVVLVNGSWFEPHEKSPRIPIAESSFVCTNMTYDHGV